MPGHSEAPAHAAHPATQPARPEHSANPANPARPANSAHPPYSEHSARPPRPPRPPHPAHIAGRRVDHGPFRPVTALIEEQTDRTPHRPAVTCHEGTDELTLTYAEFDALANGLAAELAAAGVRAGDTVPVVIGNSVELPLSMVALMKLGAAFVPCDPAWPEERLAAVHGVLAPPLALTAAPLFRSRPTGHLVDRHALVPRRERPDVRVRPGTPAYGVFTSGSTGTPKCALNLHRGLTNRFRFMSRHFAATGDEVVLQNSRHTFDSAIWQLLWPLTTGGRTIVPEQGEFLDLERTVDAVARHRVTVTDFVPAILAMLVALLESDPASVPRVASLRHLVVGGEEIIPRAVHRLRELVPGLTVTNGYGPSETSIGMVFHRVAASDGDQIPLGRPIDNCYVIVADPHTSRPLPPGTPGEILVGGACVGAGYLGDPERTAAAFVPNPYEGVPGEVLYRTGDLGRLDAGGLLRFDGRSDRQAQVDGVRVELAEIETTAENCPGVVQAKAMTLPHGDRTRLVLTAAAGDSGLTPAALRARLRSALPHVQVPHHCFVLPSLPLTDTGKVDLRTLRAYVTEKLAPEAGRPGPEAPGAGRPGPEAPGAGHLGPEPPGAYEPNEATVTDALRSALGAPGLGPHDDFFAHGADSLTALDAVIRLRAATGATVLLSDLYAHRTPAALTTALTTPRAAASGTGGGEDAEAVDSGDAGVGAVGSGAVAPGAVVPGDADSGDADSGDTGAAPDPDLRLMDADARLPSDVARTLRNLPRSHPAPNPVLRPGPRAQEPEAVSQRTDDSLAPTGHPNTRQVHGSSPSADTPAPPTEPEPGEQAPNRGPRGEAPSLGKGRARGQHPPKTPTGTASRAPKGEAPEATPAHRPAVGTPRQAPPEGSPNRVPRGGAPGLGKGRARGQHPPETPTGTARRPDDRPPNGSSQPTEATAPAPEPTPPERSSEDALREEPPGGEAPNRGPRGGAPGLGKGRARGEHPPESARPAPVVLVTGATGFVGARTVHTLLRTTDAHLVCLVRARDDAEAAARLQHALAKQESGDQKQESGDQRTADDGPAPGTHGSPAPASRLTVRRGDLAAPRFGLPRSEWRALAAECDAVLHIGALVNFLLDYRAHRPANVHGTAEALRFALARRVKPLHHVSTLGVLDRHAVAASASGPLGEDCDPAAVTPPASGYSRSKWVAERLLSAAARAGAPVTVYRLGEVMPAADNGVPNPRSLTHLLLSAFHRLGVRPDVPVRSDWTTVDAVAARLAAGLAEPATGAAYHVFDGGSVDFTELDLTGDVSGDGLTGEDPTGGDAQRRVPPAEFMAALRSLAESETGSRRDSAPALLYALLSSLPPVPGTGHPDFRRLLTDNPALFTRDACAALDARHGLAGRPLAPSVAAYRTVLARAGATGPGRAPDSTRPART